MTISKAQIGLVHVAKAKLRLDDQTYRDILHLVGGAETAKELSADAFRRVMDHFASLGFKSDWRTRNFGDRPGMATPGQVALIRKLWAEWSDDADERALGHWLQNSYGVSSLRFLDSSTAAKAIAGLKAMAARKRAPQVA